MLPLPLPQVSRTDELFLKTRVKRGSCHLTGELKQIEPCCARTGTGSGFNPCIFIDLPWRQREKNLSASVTSANRAKPSQAEVDVSNQPRPARPGSLPSLGMLLTDRRSRSITGWFAPARPGSGGPTACLALLFLAWNDIPIDLWSADWSAHTRTDTAAIVAPVDTDVTFPTTQPDTASGGSFKVNLPNVSS